MISEVKFSFKSVQLFVYLITTILLGYVGVLGVLKEVFVVTGTSAVCVSIIIFRLCTMTSMDFSDTKVTLIGFWSKKIIWEVNFSEMRKVEVYYISDNKGRGKRLTIFSNKNYYVGNVCNVDMYDLNEIFKEYKIPVYHRGKDYITNYNTGESRRL